jgi:putative transposase
VAQKKLALTLPRAERLALVEREGHDLPLVVQADLLSLSRASLYYKPVAPSPEEIRVKHRIDEIYTKYPFYGSRRIGVQLQYAGVEINRKVVQRHMREMGIEGIAPVPNLSRRNTVRRAGSPFVFQEAALARSHLSQIFLLFFCWAISISVIQPSQELLVRLLRQIERSPAPIIFERSRSMSEPLRGLSRKNSTSVFCLALRWRYSS